MFIGHWAPAFLAAAASPRAPKLGTLFVAGQLVDWGFFGLTIVEIEKMRIEPGATAMNSLDLYHMPYTHSLLGSAVWALAFAAILVLWRRDLTAALIGGAVVVSHWLLDLLVHRPDLTLAGSPPKLGMGLWNYPIVEMPLELGLVGLCFWLYLRNTKGPVGPPLILLVVLLALQAFNWFAPEPESWSIAMSLLGFFGFGLPTLIAVWVGSTRRHKRAV